MEESGWVLRAPLGQQPRVILTAARAGSPAPQPSKTLLQLVRLVVPVVLHRFVESDTKSLTIWRHSSSCAVSLSSQKKSVKALRLVSEPLLPAPQLFQGTLKKIFVH